MFAQAMRLRGNLILASRFEQGKRAGPAAVAWTAVRQDMANKTWPTRHGADKTWRESVLELSLRHEPSG